MKCSKCRSFRSKNPKIPCSRCNPIEIPDYTFLEAVDRFAKKPVKFKVGDRVECVGCPEITEGVEVRVKRNRKRKMFVMDAFYDTCHDQSHWRKVEPAKKSNTPYIDALMAVSKGKKHEDTTFTLSKDKIYLCQGNRPMRTFKEIL